MVCWELLLVVVVEGIKVGLVSLRVLLVLGEALREVRCCWRLGSWLIPGEDAIPTCGCNGVSKVGGGDGAALVGPIGGADLRDEGRKLGGDWRKSKQDSTA